MIYVVVDIETEAVLAQTESDLSAAQALTEGTTFGSGWTIEEAKALALLRARRWREVRGTKRRAAG